MDSDYLANLPIAHQKIQPSVRFLLWKEILQEAPPNKGEIVISKPSFLFGGKSLMTQSHGQSLMSFFKARYRIKGLYLLDEPETALSPKSQLELLRVISDMSNAGHAQFIIATHSPILMACPEAKIYSFNHIPVKQVDYEETEYYRIYKGFMEDRGKYLEGK